MIYNSNEQWRDILFLISNNDIVRYNELLKMEITAFWNFYLRFKKSKELELQQSKK